MTNSYDASRDSNSARFWGKVADRYLAIRESRYDLVFPVVRKLVREANARRVLDYGCGDGRLLREMVSNGEIEEGINYDISEEMCRLAEKGLPQELAVRVVRSLGDVNRGTIDMVVSIAVWMCQTTEGECQKMLREIREVLKPGGRFVAAVTHPCFRWFAFNSFEAEFSPQDYCKSGKQFKVVIRDGGQSVVVTDTHWTIGDMTRQLCDSDFVIGKIVEVTDGDGPCPWMIIDAMRTSK